MRFSLAAHRCPPVASRHQPGLGGRPHPGDLLIRRLCQAVDYPVLIETHTCTRTLSDPFLELTTFCLIQYFFSIDMMIRLRLQTPPEWPLL